MAGKILVSTAYIPPVAYFSLLSSADEVLIEREENYVKQTYRNRCYILSANGPHILSVPVLIGSFHKTAVKDIRIDFSKRWQQVHLRAMIAAYRSSPYFEYYFDKFEQIIAVDHEFLLDLNMEFILLISNILRIDTPITYTTHFEPVTAKPADFRYTYTPKKPEQVEYREYMQVFQYGKGFVPGLSIADLIFNMGPDSYQYL
ncbi:MAG: hypothetical protein A2X05_07890 [Bacteroidetes bacterium GWE2_41_25]|nr:MAG: hypothetical protein A2X03_02405 [Bacteroidetes bacterium GWA2_40_15]OFX94816.1 MAG: hypothetical protein A2X06_17105 [Bacteroidetes bacterium GWC2_40_22]OFY00469.1 MAG: hypothetical protein A2X05_07890 [Bacteroidetes bacterium GWE2_41_25]OFY60934.1 MAG: hypothetical protein A2X04_09510 [Bacteroidetes bacterium GWF2_41_9]HBH85085.1 hypothetical protein [Bacteroidales bacterium]